TLPPVIGVFRAEQASVRPSITSENCHMICGFSGLPKLRQLVAATGVAPVQDTLRAASATACIAPSFGASQAQRPLPSSAIARARLVPLMRIKGTRRALAMALDGNGRWAWLAPKLGAMHAVAEAARNVSCTGATPVAATNCLNFGNPEKPQIMWQFSEVIDGLTEACSALNTPITGGNVSLYNETLGEGIYTTPVVGVVGILEDVE